MGPTTPIAPATIPPICSGETTSFTVTSGTTYNFYSDEELTNLLETNTTQFSSMGAGMGLDVYNGLRNVYQLHRANLQILASKYQLDNMKDDIKLMVANAYLQIMFNSEILKVQKSQNFYKMMQVMFQPL